MLVEQIEWFKSELPCPHDKYFDPIFKSGYCVEPVCWFKGHAKLIVNKCWNLKALVELCDMPIDVCHRRDPGIILFEDDYQAVALASWKQSRFL